MKIITAEIETRVGDLGFNEANITSVLNSYRFVDEDVLVVFPELCVTGYPPLDLLKNPIFLKRQWEVVKNIIKIFADCPKLYFILGAVSNEENDSSSWQDKNFNSALLCNGGNIIHNYDKVLLPTYTIFDEKRYFVSGNTNKSIFRLDGVYYALFICEDVWASFTDEYNSDPVEEHSSDRIENVIIINASPYSIGKFDKRVAIVKNCGKLYQKANIYYVNMRGHLDGIYFDGKSLTWIKGDSIKLASGVDPSHYIEGSTFPVKNVHDIIVDSIRDYCNRNGFSSIVVGSSGGIDSAVVIALAVEAVGRDCVTAITIPTKNSSKGSVNDSEKLCKRLGVKLFNFNIGNEHDVFVEKYTKVFGKPSELAIQNAQPRERAKVLLTYSNSKNALLLNTGNKSEISVGYFTYGGDSSGGFAPIGDLYKTEVMELAKYINRESEIIPNQILTKPPSAELAPDQKDNDDLPPYDVLDSILKMYIDGEDKMDHTIKIFSKYNYELPKIAKEVTRVIQKVNRNEFKRDQIPNVVHIHDIPYGRARQLPITNPFCDSFEFFQSMKDSLL